MVPAAAEVMQLRAESPELRAKSNSEEHHSRGNQLRRSEIGLWTHASGLHERFARAAHLSRGFTLLEILLAVALLGLLSAALVSTAVHLADGKPHSPEEIFWEAVRSARKTALRTQSEVSLRFDSKKMEFALGAPGVNEALETFPVPPVHDLTVDFLHADGGNGAVLIGGQVVETQTMPVVTFYGDGTCVPFRIQFRTTGPAHVLSIDPWTCAPVLIANKS